MTATTLGTLGPRERRIETAAETSARIARGHEEAKRLACPYPLYIYKCECGEEWAHSNNGYAISMICEACGEVVGPEDNPLRAAWFEGFARCEELSGRRETFLTDELHSIKQAAELER